jgi:hypothetical protein
MRFKIPFLKPTQPEPPAGTPPTCRKRPTQAVRHGDYLRSGQALYCVEQLIGKRAVIEDCRNGDLFDIELDQLGRLQLVKPGSSARPRENA